MALEQLIADGDHGRFLRLTAEIGGRNEVERGRDDGTKRKKKEQGEGCPEWEGERDRRERKSEIDTTRAARRKGNEVPEGKTDRASIIRLDISGIFTKGTRRNACSIS